VSVAEVAIGTWRSATLAVAQSRTISLCAWLFGNRNGSSSTCRRVEMAGRDCMINGIRGREVSRVVWAVFLAALLIAVGVVFC
jgi:hypothetical protein